ncbi:MULTISPECIES: hypothetical protein [Akkermansia]|jgi:hypothetical protein|uniref:hypothetical protein n=1 Tax=Akkermansia sp. TaxID=1872421 RepID=UPI001C0357E6|nr:hypothetical protein [Candidatus Akkermansia timonensis]MBT9562056.1 hypothetical protein [Candidatus Akkermansia timonensis]
MWYVVKAPHTRQSRLKKTFWPRAVPTKIGNGGSWLRNNFSLGKLFFYTTSCKHKKFLTATH